MNLSPHFTLKEFTDSDIAARNAIDNGLPEHLLPNALRTASMLERIRLHLSYLIGHDVPIIITSGYRCLELNSLPAINSRPTSDHIKALSADIKAPAFGTPYALCKALQPVMHVLEIGQLIYEFGSWAHVSVRTPIKDINRVLTITSAGPVPGIVKV